MHLAGFIIKKFVTMHGHRNVKCAVSICSRYSIDQRDDRRMKVCKSMVAETDKRRTMFGTQMSTAIRSSPEPVQFTSRIYSLFRYDLILASNLCFCLC